MEVPGDDWPNLYSRFPSLPAGRGVGGGGYVAEDARAAMRYRNLLATCFECGSAPEVIGEDCESCGNSADLEDRLAVFQMRMERRRVLFQWRWPVGVVGALGPSLPEYLGTVQEREAGVLLLRDVLGRG